MSGVNTPFPGDTSSNFPSVGDITSPQKKATSQKKLEKVKESLTPDTETKREIKDVLVTQEPKSPEEIKLVQDVATPIFLEASETKANIKIPKYPKLDKPAENHMPEDRGEATRLLAHIHADEFGAGSELEGFYSSETLAFLGNFLDSLPQSHKKAYGIEDIIDLFNESILLNKDLDPTDHGIATLQRPLDAGREVLLIGGWTSSTKGKGHAMYYQLIPEPSGKVTMRIFNLGAGSQTHYSAFVGNKEKSFPFVEWGGIDKSKILSKDFLRAIKELRTETHFGPDKNTDTSYGANDIYNGLRNFLAPEKITLFPGESGIKLLMTQQRAGFCSWRGLMAFLRTKMDKEAYKHLKLQLKLQSLLSYIDRKSTEPIDPKELRLVNKSFQKLCRSLDKLHEQALVDEKYLNRAYELLLPVKNWIKINKADIVPEQDIQEIEENAFEGKLKDLPGEPALFSISNEEIPLDKISIGASQEIQSLTFTDPDIFPESLRRALENTTQDWKDGNDISAHANLINLIDKLPKDQEFWTLACGKDPEKAKELIVELGNLQQLFFSTCFTIPQAQARSPEKLLAATKLLYLQTQLLQNVSPLLADVKPQLELANKFLSKKSESFSNEYLYFHSFDGEKDKEIQELFQWLSDSSEHTSNPKFDYKTSYSSNATLNYEFKFQYNSGYDKPSVLDQFRKIDPAFQSEDNLPKHQQDARLYSSDDLPEWFKSLRDGTVFTHILMSENIGLIQETKNSRELLKPVFKVSDNKRDVSTISMMIDGIDWERVRHGQNGKSPLGLYAPFDKKYDDFCTSLQFSMQNATETSLSSNDDLGGSGKTKRDLEELRNIFYCTLEPELTLQSTLELFSRHPEYLLNPNYQMFFQMFMFQVGYMNKAVELPGFKENLVQFLEKNITNFRLNNEFPAAIFLIRMARYSSNYFENPSLDNLSLLRDMASTEEIPPSIKSLIYNELLCALGKKEQGELERKDVEDIFKAMSYTQRYPVGARETDFFIKNDIQKSFLKHSFQLTKALSDQDEMDYLINLAVKEAFPEEPYLEWQNITRDEALPVFTAIDGRCEYYPTSGRIIFPGKIGLLPHYLKEDATFKKMFPQISEATQLTGDIYSFRDSFGVETRVRKKSDGDELIIEQLRGDDYVRYVNPSIFLKTKKDDEDQKVSRLQSRFIVDNFDHWISEKNFEDKKTLNWVNPHNGEIIYVASVEADDDKPQIENIVRVADKAVLNTTSQAFNFFEDEQFIHEWFFEGNLVEVEFPRYALTLKPDITGKLVSPEFPGFYLKPKEKIKSLGAYKHYMVLENASGEKKVLLPQIHFKEPKKLKEVFEPRYEVKWDQDSSEPKSRKLLTFDVLSNGKLSSKSRAANLYLAEVALLMQDYKNAGKYLREFGTKLEAYTPEELEIINQIANLEDVTGDNSGNAWAIRTYAGYLLIKNSEDFAREGKTKKEEIKLDISSTYTKYISHYRSVTDLKLTRDEELYLVRRIRKNITTPEIEARFIELTGGDTPSRKHIIPEKIVGELKPSVSTLSFDTEALSEIFSYSSYSYNRGVKPSDFPMTKIFDAEDGLALSNGYKFARNTDPSNDEERNLLRQGIPWADKTYKENKHKVPLLNLILDQPERFPEMPSNFESLRSEERKEFWKNVLEVANILASEGSIVSYESAAHKPTTLDLTPKSFKLDSQKKLSNNESAKAATSSQASLKNLAEFPQIAKLFTSSETPRFKPVDISLSSKNTDPLVHKEVKRLANDAVGLARQNPPLTYSISSPEQLSNANGILNDISELATLELNVLETQILELARKQPVTSSARALSSIQSWGGKQKPLKLGELIVNFGKQDPDLLMSRNPALSSKDVEALYSKLGEYLQIATRQQQAKRALSTLGKREEAVARGDSKAIEELTQQLASDLLATRSYNHINQPAFLVFEYFADILMRKKQVDMIDAFLKGKDTNPMMEMIMGSGKSKVLLPLLGLLRAQPENLSMLIVPDPLFGSVSSDTQKILGDAFYVSLHTLDFDRNTPLSEGHLENILEELKSIQKNKECLILTSKSISCMVLKYIEQASIEFQESKGTKEMSNELKLLSEILGIFSKSGNPLLDEADLLLNALHEVSFSLGDAHGPRQEESDLITHLYDTIYTNPEVRKLVSIESDPSPNISAPALTEQNYETIKHPLSHILIESFKTIIMENKPLEAVIRNYFRDLSERDKTIVLHYLNRDEEFIGEAQRFYNSQSKEIQEFLSLAGEELNSTLPHTLTRNCNEKYGLDDSGVVSIAIPYSAATVPSYGSQFANHHVTMNYTIQAYVKQNISKKVLEIEIRRLQKSARQEIQDSESVKTLENTEAWKVFNEIKGDLNIPLFNMNDKQLNLLLTSVNADTQKKLNLIKKIILPQITVHDKKISINPINLLSFLPWASGFTGTLWNSASMHRKVSPIPAEGTDALTISLLAQHSQDKIHTIDRSTPAKMLDEIQSFGTPFSLLADAGGYFKDENNFENAKLLQIKTGKPVVFYNEFGQQTIWDGSKTTPFTESKLKEGERITYLDQSHTTGADVKQKLDAVGYVTIGDKMLLRDLLQAVWRLRGLEKSQRVEFILAKDVEALIRQTLNLGDNKITFQEILKFVIYNQANQQGKENFMAFNQELDDLSQHILLSILLDPNSSPQDSDEALKTLGSTWIKPMNESAGTLYGTISKKTDSAEVCKTKAEAVKASLKKITNKEAERALQDVDQIVKRYQTCLPEKIMARVGNEDMTVEMEQKKSVEVEKELEFVNQSLNKGGALGEMTIGSNAPILHSVSVISDEIFKDWGKYNNLYNAYESALSDQKDGMNVVVPPKPTFDLPIPVLSVSQWMTMSDDLKDYAGAFKGIEFSLNMFQWPSKDPKASDLQLFGQHSKPIHYMNVEAGRITVLNSAEAAAHMRHDMNKSLYNRTTGYCVSGKSLESADQVQFENLIKIKFLSGESNYKPDELKFLEFWLKANNSNKMYNLFREKILAGHLLKQDEFLDSSLQRLFKKLNIGKNETESTQSPALDLMNKRKQEDYEHA